MTQRNAMARPTTAAIYWSSYAKHVTAERRIVTAREMDDAEKQEFRFSI